MICQWNKPEGKVVCVVCGTKRKSPVIRPCGGPPCVHLGEPLKREGVTVRVKCGCSKTEHDQPHAAHECEVYKRCLPTLVPADKEKWLERPESEIYRCCFLCELNPSTNPTLSKQPEQASQSE